MVQCRDSIRMALTHMKTNIIKRLGYAGLIPFVASAAGHLSGLPTAQIGVLYGAIILSFLGGIQWGTGLRGHLDDSDPTYRIVVSVVPSIIAFAAVLMAPPYSVVLLLGGFVGQWRYDRAHSDTVNWPPWFLDLRTHLSIGALVCLGLLLVP